MTLPDFFYWIKYEVSTKLHMHVAFRFIIENVFLYPMEK